MIDIDRLSYLDSTCLNKNQQSPHPKQRSSKDWVGGKSMVCDGGLRDLSCRYQKMQGNCAAILGVASCCLNISLTKKTYISEYLHCRYKMKCLVNTMLPGFFGGFSKVVVPPKSREDWKTHQNHPNKSQALDAKSQIQFTNIPTTKCS